MPQQGAEHGHAERSAGLAGGVQDAAGHARVPGAGRAHYRRGHGRHGQRDQAEQDRAGQDQRERGGGTGRGEQGRADGAEGESGDHRRPRPEARGQRPAGQRADADGDAHRQQQPGGQHGLVPVVCRQRDRQSSDPYSTRLKISPTPVAPRRRAGSRRSPGRRRAARRPAGPSGCGWCVLGCVLGPSHPSGWPGSLSCCVADCRASLCMPPSGRFLVPRTRRPRPHAIRPGCGDRDPRAPA